LDDVREEYAETTKERFKHHIGNIRKGKDFGVQKLHPLGKQPDDWWQIQPIAPSAKERLGYPTQKPEALLEKIVKASSNKGSLVADFFGGCGTTISVAQNLKRKWLGVDISHLAIGLIERRLIKSYGKVIKDSYEIDGLPKDISSAKQLAEGTSGGRLKFQDWIIEAMLGGVHNPRKTADGGWDGHLTFEMPNHQKQIILIEVKSGNVNVKNLREFIQVINKQKAAIGVFVCFDKQVTKPMRLEAKDAGYYKKEIFGANYDRIQIMTVEKLIEAEEIKMPNILTTTFKTAKGNKENVEHPELFKDK
jgi:site-specific DNA-methyltransferase (adenine-specific)